MKKIILKSLLFGWQLQIRISFSNLRRFWTIATCVCVCVYPFFCQNVGVYRLENLTGKLRDPRYFLFLLAGRQGLPPTDYWFSVGEVSPERNRIYSAENGDSHGMCTIWKRVTRQNYRDLWDVKRPSMRAFDVPIRLAFFISRARVRRGRRGANNGAGEKTTCTCSLDILSGNVIIMWGVLLLLLRWKKKKIEKKKTRTNDDPGADKTATVVSYAQR